MSSLLRRSRSILLLPLCVSVVACKSQIEPAVTDNASAETVVSSTPPFQTKEPERYQATRTITITTPGSDTVVTKTYLAKDGDMRRQESETASKRVAYLELSEGRFVLLLDDKVYADTATDTDNPAEEDADLTPERLLHTDASTTTYQNMGKEVVSGRTSSKYRVVNSSGPGNVSVSETLIWIDEVLNMPIKSETTSPDGTRVTMELSDITLEVDVSTFQVPDHYEKVAFSELRKRLTTTD